MSELLLWEEVQNEYFKQHPATGSKTFDYDRARFNSSFTIDKLIITRNCIKKKGEESKQ